MFLNIDKKTNEILYIIDNIKELEETEDRKFIKTNIKDIDFLTSKNFYIEETKKIKSIKMLENSVKQVFNYKKMKWEEQATLEEQKNYYLNESLKIGKKMEEYRNIGLQGGQEYIVLEKELEVNKNKYIELCHVEALEMNSISDNTN